MRDFKQLDIWKRSFTLAKEVYYLSSQLPISEQYGLKSQINRAAVSIPSNIAEGCGRDSDKDLGRFLIIAQGPSFELETQLLLMKALFDIPNIDHTLNEIQEIQRMISGYRRNINSKT